MLAGLSQTGWVGTVCNGMDQAGQLGTLLGYSRNCPVCPILSSLVYPVQLGSGLLMGPALQIYWLLESFRWNLGHAMAESFTQEAHCEDTVLTSYVGHRQVGGTDFFLATS